MSWNIQVTGTRAAVRKFVADEMESGRLPAPIAESIIEVCNDANATSSNGVSVMGWGHLGGGTGNFGNFSVTPVDLLGVGAGGEVAAAEETPATAQVS